MVLRLTSRVLKEISGSNLEVGSLEARSVGGTVSACNVLNLRSGSPGGDDSFSKAVDSIVVGCDLICISHPSP